MCELMFRTTMAKRLGARPDSGAGSRRCYGRVRAPPHQRRRSRSCLHPQRRLWSRPRSPTCTTALTVLPTPTMTPVVASAVAHNQQRRPAVASAVASAVAHTRDSAHGLAYTYNDACGRVHGRPQPTTTPCGRLHAQRCPRSRLYLQ
jgi:hypothetical protein